MNRYSTERYRYPSQDRYSSLSRSKSPYRSTSSLNSHASSSSNLKVDTDNFDQLNKSLGRHDASFVRGKDGSSSSKSGANLSKLSRDSDSSRYGSLGKDRFNVGKLNKDYSTNKYKLADDSRDSSSDYDLNNNYQFSGYGASGKAKAACVSGSESDEYDLTTPTYPIRSAGRSTLTSTDKVSTFTY